MIRAPQLAAFATLAALAGCGARTELLTCSNAANSDECATSSSAAGVPSGVGGSAGTAPNNGGTGDVVGLGGSGGFPGAGAGGSAGVGASGVAGGATVAPHWIALSVSHVAYAYDVTRYPSGSGLFQLSSAPPDLVGSAPAVGPWSPDGKKLLYRDGTGWYVRDMTANPPQAGTLVVAMPVPPDPSVPLPQSSWSADSSTIAWVAARALAVVDPTQPMNRFHVLSETATSYSWAPAGGHLLYAEPGFVLARVDAGYVASQQILPQGTLTTWSPDGKYLAMSMNGGLTLIDVSGPTVVTNEITQPTIATPSVTQIMFSADSSFLVFVGAQVRPQTDVFYVALKPSIGAPVLISNGPANMTFSADRVLFLSPDSHWIGYSTTDSTQAFAAEIAGGKTVFQFPLQLQGYTRYAYLPKQPQDFLAFATNSAELFNLPDSNPTFIPTPGSSTQSLSPVADVLLWSDNPSQISLRDLDTLAPASSTDAKLENNKLAWSPDGQFISLLDAEAEPGGEKIELVQVTGAVPSARVAIGPGGSPDSTSVWQPVFP